MKLKKIASLMLAGVMTVSMLTACGGNANDDTQKPNQPEESVATSYSTMLQSKLSAHANSSITLSDDADLNNALNYAGGYVGHTTIADNFLRDIFGSRGVAHYVDDGLRSELAALEVAMNYLNDTLKTKVVNNGDVKAYDQIMKLDPWAGKADPADPAWYEKDDVNTVLLYVVDGSVKMENVMDEVADDIDKAIKNLTEVGDSNDMAGDDIDNEGTYGDSEFSYTGSVAVYNDVYEAGHGMSISLVAVEIVRHIA